MDYKPKVVDTSEVKLSEDLIELTEYLARNTHDHWALARIAQGWKYGKKRDDTTLEHPCLIPYEDLPESEKKIDRNTAMETIKTILALGYSVEIPVNKFIKGIHKSNKNLISYLKSENVEIEHLYYIWKGHEVLNWSREVDLYIRASEKALELGEPLLSYNIINEGKKFFPDNIRIKQLLGLSLARVGASREGNAVLLELYQNFHDKSEETLGMIGRTYKDIASDLSNKTEKDFFLKMALNFYAQSFDLYKSIWAGVNIATLHLLLNEKDKAREMGEKIIDICNDNPEMQDEYWRLASLGEAHLIKEEYSKAISYYENAVKFGKNRVGVINTTRKNALIVLKALNTPLKEFRQIENTLSVPKIIIFTGHRIDEKDREKDRFPAAYEKKVYKKIVDYISTLGPAVGYSSAANGADILFLEAMKECGNSCNIILPYNEKDFVDNSVISQTDPTWEKRYREIIANPQNTIYELRDQGSKAIQNSYEFANSFILGMAKLKASQLETLIYPLAVWHRDELQKDCLPGGTTYTLKSWYRDNEFVEVIDLKDIDSPVKSPSVINTDFGEIVNAKTNEDRYQTKGILFSDTVNYTSLSNEEFVIFEEKILGLVEEIVSSNKYKIDYKNTWGDALHIIFPDLKDTAEFALELNEKLKDIDWEEMGFRKKLEMRVAIHAGQVAESVNPITKKKHFNGANVCRAARLEPMTPPGQVYCTQEFAALANALNLKEYNCLYVGELALPKGFGIYPIFHLRRALR